MGVDIPIFTGLGDWFQQLLGQGQGNGVVNKGIVSPDSGGIYGTPPSSPNAINESQSQSQATVQEVYQGYIYSPTYQPTIPNPPGIPWWVFVIAAGVTAYAVAPTRKR